MRRCGSGAVLAALLGGLGLAAPPARADVSGPAIVSYLNAQRAAQGIPAGIVEDPSLSDGCAKHNAWGSQNGKLQHSEDPGSPGYTDAGNQAAQTSVLYEGSGPWTATHDPFESAPIHLHQLLAPRIDRMGAAETAGYGCATTLASLNRPAPPADVTYTYPGNGALGWPASETANEGPYTPGQELGIPADTPTGPYLYVMFDGPELRPFDSAHVTAGSLSGPTGPVAVLIADNTTPGLTGYLPTGAEIIPRAALAPGTTYTATIAASVTTEGGSGPARPFTHTWTFTTAPRPNAVRITRAALTGHRLRLSVSSAAPGGTAAATGPGPSAHAPIVSGGATLTLGAAGTWKVCAATGGGATGYAAAGDCRSVKVAKTPAKPARRFVVSSPARVRHGHRLRVALRGRARFTVRFRLSTIGGRTLARSASHRLAGGRTWVFHLRVPQSENHRGRRFVVRIALRSGAKTLSVRRVVRVT